MLKRYELTDDEWNRIADLFPTGNTGKHDRPPKDNQLMLNGIIWIVCSGAHGVTCQTDMVHGHLSMPVSVNGLMMAF